MRCFEPSIVVLAWCTQQTSSRQAEDKQRVHDVLDRFRDVDADMQVLQIGASEDKRSIGLSCIVDGLLK